MGLFSKIKNFFSGIVDTIVNIGKSIFNFIGDVFSFVVAPFGAVPTPNVSANAGETAKGITVTKNGTTVNIPIVYGYRRLGGSIVFAETNGDTNKYLYVCYVLCQGEIEGIRRLFIDDIEIPTAMMTGTNNTLPTGTVLDIPSGRFKGLVQLQVFNGASGDVQSTLLNGSNSWSNEIRTIPSVAYVACKFTFPDIKTQDDQENNPWKGGIPTINAEVLGKKVYDISQLPADSAGYEFTTSYATLTKTYSINPVNQLLDYMMDPTWGCGIPATDIEPDSFVRSANKCLQYVEYYDGQSGRALTGNQVILTDQKLIENVKELVKACRGIMPYVQGQYKIEIEDGGNKNDIKSASAYIVYQVDDDDVVGGITMRGEAKNTKYNQVVVNYIEPETDFQNQSIAYPETDSTLYTSTLSEDNNEILKGEFNFPSITNKYIAKDLAIMIFKKSRNQRQISFTGRPELMAVVVGDCIEVTNARLGLSSTSFRVTGMNIRADSTVSIEAVEHIETNYPYILQDEQDTYEQPKQSDPILPDPIQPTPQPQPPGVVPPVDPDPNPPQDIEPNPPTDGTDSAGYPVAPIQNPVPAPAPDEIRMPSPTDVPVIHFQPIPFTPRTYTITEVGTYGSVLDAIAGTTLAVGTEVPVSNFEYAEVLDPQNFRYTYLDFRNLNVKKNNKLPFTWFQAIADNTGGGDNPWYTNGEYGGVPVDSTVAAPRAFGDEYTISTMEHFMNDYIDSTDGLLWPNYVDPSIGGGEIDSIGDYYDPEIYTVVPPVRVTFTATHPLQDGDALKFPSFADMGDWQYWNNQQPVYNNDGSLRSSNLGENRYLYYRTVYAKRINTTQIDLYFDYNLTQPINFSQAAPNTWTSDRKFILPSISNGGKLRLRAVAAGGNSQSKILKSETRETFEKLKSFRNCSIWNPYEDWTVGQNLGNTGSLAVSSNIGRVPQCTFEAPNDFNIRTRGPKGLYPKIKINPPAGLGGIVIYRGKIGGGLDPRGGYIFHMKDSKWTPSTFEGLSVYAWPWAGGNGVGLNPALMVQSNRDFFKIRFSDTWLSGGNGDKVMPGTNLYTDGSFPTPDEDPSKWFYFDPSTRYDLPGWTYTNEKGETVHGYGVEAYLNYSIQQLSADAFEDNGDSETEVGLGD